MKTEQILNEREKTHGDFEECASLTYDMKKVIGFHLAMDRRGPDDNNKIIKKTHLISINMILLKIARIICGNPNHDDHWDDIAGYAMLGRGKAKGVFEPDTEWPKNIDWPKMANEPCDHPNKERKYFADTADGLETIMTVDYCYECNKMHIVDCEQKEAEKSATHQEDYWKDIFINKIKDEFDFVGKRFDLMVDWLKNISEDLAELNESKNSTSSKMEHEGGDVKFWCDGCEKEKIGGRMTETNGLLNKLLEKITEVFHAKDKALLNPERNPGIVVDEAFLLAQVYGKAEFERGYKTAHTEKRFESDTHFYDLRDENKTLKDQNKELMRENLELKKKVDEKEYFDYINDVHNRAMKNSLDELKQAVEDGCSQYEEIFKKKFGCHPFDYRFPCVSADEIFEAKEPEWYDAEKCLPLRGATVRVYFEEVRPALFEKGQKICFPGNFDGFRWNIYALENGHKEFNEIFIGANIMDFKIIKWRYADE